MYDISFTNSQFRHQNTLCNTLCIVVEGIVPSFEGLLCNFLGLERVVVRIQYRHVNVLRWSLLLPSFENRNLLPGLVHTQGFI